jgi:hypothetical protein
MPLYRVPQKYMGLGFPERISLTIKDGKLGLLPNKEFENNPLGWQRIRLLRVFRNKAALPIQPVPRSRFERILDEGSVIE